MTQKIEVYKGVGKGKRLLYTVDVPVAVSVLEVAEMLHNDGELKAFTVNTN